MPAAPAGSPPEVPIARILLLGVGLIALAAVWAFTCVSKRFERLAAGVAPLEIRHFEELTVVTVGTGGTFENPLRLGPSIAVARGPTIVLVDAGRGVCEALRAAAIPVHQPATLVLSSLLPENTLGLDDLIVTRGLEPQAGPLAVYGPPGTRALVEALLAGHGPGLRAQAENGLGGAPPVSAEDVTEARELEAEGLALHAAPLPGGPLPGLAWRFEANGRALLVSSAGWAPDALVEAGVGAALWVHEALNGAALEKALQLGAERPERLRREAALHTRLDEIGALATRMGVDTLVLTRLRPPPVFDFEYRRLVAPSFEGRVIVAADGLEIRL